MSLVVAAVILNAFTWASFLVGDMPVFHDGQDGWVWFLLVVTITSPLQAAAEEVFFRGYLLQVIGSATGRAWAGVVGSALIFALLHGVQSPALFAHRLAFGLVAGALVVVTGGLEAGIAAHVVNNVAAYGYAMFTTSVAELRGVTTISWAEAGWNVAAFAAFGVAAWWLGSPASRRHHHPLTPRSPLPDEALDARSRPDAAVAVAGASLQMWLWLGWVGS